MEKNIALAIQRESEYIYDKIHNNDINLNIYDYLKDTGYSDLDEFRSDAKDYWVKSQNYEIVEEPEISSSVPVPYLNSKTPAFLYTINCAYNYAFIPASYDNYDLIREYGYTPVKLGYDNSNGPILSSNGDLRIYLILGKHENIDITYGYFLSKFKTYFDRYFDNVVSSNNDILIDGNKVLGGSLFEYNDMLIIVFQINFVDKRNDILHICGVSPKTPGYIDSSIITAEQTKNEFLTWLQ